MQLEIAQQRFADLLVNFALNIQPGQILEINADNEHRPFMLEVAKSAYQAGAKRVQFTNEDIDLLKIRLQHAQTSEFVKSLPPGYQANFDELARSGATLKICDSDDLNLPAELKPRYKDYSNEQNKAKNEFYTARDNYDLHWVVSTLATIKWAEKLFPDLKGEAARDRLNQDLFSFLRIDREDYLDFWKRYNQKLMKTTQALKELGIVRFKIKGPETDLEVGLSPNAVFAIGASENRQKKIVQNNIPSEECFTSPDWRTVQGEVKITRPVLVDGEIVDGLRLRFKDGILNDFSADIGLDSFTLFVENDPGLRKLGEFALVGENPISASGRIYYNDLIDENAEPHLALGNGFKDCIFPLFQSDEALINEGVNLETQLHQDFMFGSPDVTITAVCKDNREVLIIKNSKWQI